MQVVITQDTKVQTVVIQGKGLQGEKGKDGKDAEFPEDGNAGDVLEKTDTGVRWTNQLQNQNINGGYF